MSKNRERVCVWVDKGSARFELYVLENQMFVIILVLTPAFLGRI